MSGDIPPEFGRLGSLTFLGLHDNHLTGEIPPQLGNLSKLEILSLSGNKLSGQIPPELGRLSNLTMMSLHNNHLTGTIPDEFGQLDKLEALTLTGNGLSGCVPLWLSGIDLYDLSLPFCKTLIASSPSPTPVDKAAIIVQNVNQNIGSGGIRASHEDMVGYCETLRDINWDPYIWDELTFALADSDDPPARVFNLRREHYMWVLVGLESVSGQAKDGCAAFGVE